MLIYIKCLTNPKTCSVGKIVAHSQVWEPPLESLQKLILLRIFAESVTQIVFIFNQIGILFELSIIRILVLCSMFKSGVCSNNTTKLYRMIENRVLRITPFCFRLRLKHKKSLRRLET